ncbi:MAG: DMT family transporter, partial [Pseudomonadota bacterium]
RGIPFHLPRAAWPAGFLSGLLFAFEFMCLFTALDLTTVSRTSIIFYSMPVWLALFAHVLIPGEQLTRARVVGLILAMCGVAIALADRSSGAASWAGDLMALASAFCWAAIALCVRVTPLSQVPPAPQLLCQVTVSAPLLIGVSVFFGPLIRDLQPVHLAGMAFQIVAVASLGFMFWFWLMKLYPASGVASFSFLSPVFAVLLGWLLLQEQVGLSIWIALAMVAAGIYLINRPAVRPAEQLS